MRTTCWARIACSPATWCWRWARPGCIPTASRWPGGCWSGLGWTCRTSSPRLGRPLGTELLTPTRIYARDCLALAAGCDVHAYAHITGGGLAANLARVLPPGADAVLDRGSWRPLAVFGLLADRGGVPSAEMEQVFNMGVGMAAVIGRAEADQALSMLAGRDVPAWVLGEIVPGTGTARLTGRHPSEGSGLAPSGPPARYATRCRSRGRPHRPRRRLRRHHRRPRHPRNALRRRGSPSASPSSLPTPSSVRSRSRSVPPLLYFSWRATFTCLALARPRPIGSTPSNMRSHSRAPAPCADDLRLYACRTARRRSTA